MLLSVRSAGLATSPLGHPTRRCPSAMSVILILLARMPALRRQGSARSFDAPRRACGRPASVPSDGKGAEASPRRPVRLAWPGGADLVAEFDRRAAVVPAFEGDPPKRLKLRQAVGSPERGWHIVGRRAVGSPASVPVARPEGNAAPAQQWSGSHRPTVAPAIGPTLQQCAQRRLVWRATSQPLPVPPPPE
jgi:hypothetical protein